MNVRTKLMFWALLGCLSVIFAEVVSGSSLFPFLSLWGIIGVFPLYALHTRVLAWVVGIGTGLLIVVHYLF